MLYEPKIGPTVMKFGGTSVEDARAFERVAQIVRRHEGEQPVVVVSAMSRVTDALLRSVQVAVEGDVDRAASLLEEHFERHLKVAETLLKKEPHEPIQTAIANARRELPGLFQALAGRKMPHAVLQDVVVSYGERLSSTLLAAVLRESGLPASCVDARRCIVTDEYHGAAAPLMEETETRTRAEIGPLLETSRVPVLGGFIGASTSGATTTLGRGGSDYSAAIIGAALSAREIQIWTDVTGVLTADPRVVCDARTVSRMSYGEAAEFAYFGAKVLHPKTIQPAVDENIPVRICNSRAPEEFGTLVGPETETSARTVKAIAHKNGITTLRVTSARMLGAYGFLRALFEVFDRHRTAVDVVTTSEVSVSLSLDDTSTLPSLLSELKQIGAVEVEKNRAIVCIVGEGIRNTPGIAAQVFGAIRDINVSLISLGASSINLTFLVEEEHVREAVQRLHEAFFGNEL